jgi:drug/metabolite transporter (DMT)-like permease
MTRDSPAGIVFILLTVGLVTAGQLLMKWGLLQVGPSAAKLALLPRFLLSAVANVWVTLGLACAVVAACSWTVAISRSDLSFAYPFTAIGVVLVLTLSGLVLHEPIPVTRWLGVLVVCAGLWIASRG